jgi:hypothetical protein
MQRTLCYSSFIAGSVFPLSSLRNAHNHPGVLLLHPHSPNPPVTYYSTTLSQSCSPFLSYWSWGLIEGGGAVSAINTLDERHGGGGVGAWMCWYGRWFYRGEFSTLWGGSKLHDLILQIVRDSACPNINGTVCVLAVRGAVQLDCGSRLPFCVSNVLSSVHNVQVTVCHLCVCYVL